MVALAGGAPRYHNLVLDIFLETPGIWERHGLTELLYKCSECVAIRRRDLRAAQISLIREPLSFSGADAYVL